MANASGFAVELKTGAFEHKPSGVKYNLSLEGSQHLGLPGLLRLRRPGRNQAWRERSGTVEPEHV